MARRYSAAPDLLSIQLDFGNNTFATIISTSVRVTADLY